MRSRSGSSVCTREARTRLVSLASIASASEGSVGASVACAICSLLVLNQHYHISEAIASKRSKRNAAGASEAEQPNPFFILLYRRGIGACPRSHTFDDSLKRTVVKPAAYRTATQGVAVRAACVCPQ